MSSDIKLNPNKDHTVKISPEQVEENLRLIEDLKFFLATAPANWQKNQIIRRYYLNHEEGFVSCVFWNNLYFITGTDIVRCIVYRFEQFGREIVDRKKFEEGIFSDLRGLKCGTDAVLEPSKSPFLDFLHKSSCLRTQKKQKVFFWFSVPHDKLFADALERDLKKERSTQVGTTRSRSEPSLSFKYDSSRNLHDQLLEYAKVDSPNDVDEKFSQASENATLQMPSSNGNSSFNTPVTGSQDQISPQVVTIPDGDDNNEDEQFIPNEDDFPLDFFPPQPPIENGAYLIDPQVFLNPPERYDDQYLIDQTYAKTPFQDTEFNQSIKGKSIDQDGEDSQEYVPAAIYDQQQQYPPYVSSYYQYPTAQYQPQITNAQFYDSQISGEPLPDYPPSFILRDHTPQIPNGAYYYPPPHLQAHFQQQLHQQPYLESYPPQEYQNFMDPDQLFSDTNHQGLSPFGRFFPSFQATAPPPISSSRSRFTINKAKKPKTKLREEATTFILQQVEKGDIKVIRPGEEQLPQENSQHKDNREENEEDTYNSLPTPESTAPDGQQNQRRSQVTKDVPRREKEEELNSFLDETTFMNEKNDE
ncbi:hypothetical protein WICMUC_001896 [Wickerhamomyces mucosus]|uniref:Transcription factor n=1 Tax=Wickerhamomyces mucosus TaxID=1378264 RepID=A0A9P8PRW9_9ASCO|nr:hypothetical protein WICMUC_001896 [Wickerhamomyces mucosus]